MQSSHESKRDLSANGLGPGGLWRGVPLSNTSNHFSGIPKSKTQPPNHKPKPLAESGGEKQWWWSTKQHQRTGAYSWAVFYGFKGERRVVVNAKRIVSKMKVNVLKFQKCNVEEN